MTRPIEFIASCGAGDVGPIQADINILSDIIWREFNEAVANGDSFRLISDKLDGGHRGEMLKQRKDVCFIHPGLYIADPECFSIELLRLLICKTLAWHF